MAASGMTSAALPAARASVVVVCHCCVYSFTPSACVIDNCSCQHWQANRTCCFKPNASSAIFSAQL